MSRWKYNRSSEVPPIFQLPLGSTQLTHPKVTTRQASTSNLPRQPSAEDLSGRVDWQQHPRVDPRSGTRVGSVEHRVTRTRMRCDSSRLTLKNIIQEVRLAMRWCCSLQLRTESELCTYHPVSHQFSPFYDCLLENLPLIWVCTCFLRLRDN